VTLAAAARLPPPAEGLQVNACKRPDCRSFGVAPAPNSDATPPPRHGIGPSVFYDGRYAIGAAGTNWTPDKLPRLE